MSEVHPNQPALHKCTLIATLGSEPQVVTVALDLLIAKGEPVQKVAVIHSTPKIPGPILEALRILGETFSKEQKYKNISFHPIPILDGQGRPLADIADPNEVQFAFQTLYKVIRESKLAGDQIHLCIAGGRKTLAVFGMAAAQLLFDEEDHLWHLYSAGDFLASRRLHPRPNDQVHLIPIPVMLWSQVSPVLSDMSLVEDPWEFVEMARRRQIKSRIEQARIFVLGSLTTAEQRVVRLLVYEGLSDSDIAERLTLSPRTVEQHLRAAYRKAANYWELPEVTRTHLIALLNLYFSLELRENPHDKQKNVQ